MKYKLLIFDADKTLYDFDATEKFALENVFRAFGLPYKEEVHLKLFHEINKQIWAEFERKEISADELKPERFRRFFNRIGNDEIEPKKFSDVYLSFLAKNNELLPGAKKIIHELSADFKLVLLTNGLSFVQNFRLNSSELREYFDALIISEDVGLVKPDPQIFSLIFEELDFNDKEKTLMVGDNLSSDILGGINFGIDTCWFNPAKKENNTDITPTYEISRLYQLKSIIY